MSVGAVVQLGRFPVKSMRGESLPSAALTLQGVPNDRRYAFVQAESRSSFPWLTAREFPQLLLFQPAVQDTSSLEPEVTVRIPMGKNLSVASEELRRELEERTGKRLFLLHDARGSYDVAPVSLISRHTVARIAGESCTTEEAWRFRPNLLVDLESGAPFEELSWVGRIIKIGNHARVAVTEVDQRCMMITLDPFTAKPSPSVLRYVVQQHQQCAGVYGSVLTAGEVQVGDRISLET